MGDRTMLHFRFTMRQNLPNPTIHLCNNGCCTDLRLPDCLDMGKTPAQCGDYDQNQGDHPEISGFGSSRRMLPYFSDHLEFALEVASA
jgi:hypothetical protein